jgi:hydrogenase maturation protease
MHNASEHRRILVIGVGNRFRRDDGVGPVVADSVRARLDLARPEVLRAGQEATVWAAGPADLEFNYTDDTSPASSRSDIALPGYLTEIVSDRSLLSGMRSGLRDPSRVECCIVEHSGEGASLLEAWRHDDAVIVIDASSGCSPAGSVLEFDALESEVPSGLFRYSTHAFSVAEAIEMARILGRLPRRLRVFAIEGDDFRVGVGLTREVEQAAKCVADRVVGCIEGLMCECFRGPNPCTNSAS